MSTAVAGSLVDQAMRRIRAHIREQDLKVGDTLPGEGHFAAEFGVSRAVMREAFGALAALKLIDVGNGRKARVGAIDGSVLATSIDHAVATSQISTADVWDVRRTLEQRTAALAAEHRSDADARAIVAHAGAMVGCGDDMDQLIRHDIGFHQIIAQASGNALFHQIVRSFEPLMGVAVPAAWSTRTTADQRTEILDVHRDLGQAIADRDAAAARSFMEAHFDRSIGDIIASDSSRVAG